MSGSGDVHVKEGVERTLCEVDASGVTQSWPGDASKVTCPKCQLLLATA
jgi:hypothetical protein